MKDKHQEVLAEELNNIEGNGEVSAGCYWSVMRTSLLAVAEEVVAMEEECNLIGFRRVLRS